MTKSRRSQTDVKRWEKLAKDWGEKLSAELQESLPKDAKKPEGPAFGVVVYPVNPKTGKPYAPNSGPWIGHLDDMGLGERSTWGYVEVLNKFPGSPDGSDPPCMVAFKALAESALCSVWPMFTIAKAKKYYAYRNEEGKEVPRRIIFRYQFRDVATGVHSIPWLPTCTIDIWRVWPDTAWHRDQSGAISSPVALNAQGSQRGASVQARDGTSASLRVSVSGADTAWHRDQSGANSLPVALNAQSPRSVSGVWGLGHTPCVPISNSGARAHPDVDERPELSSSRGFMAAAMERSPFARQADTHMQPPADMRTALFAAAASGQHTAPAAGNQQWCTQPHVDVAHMLAPGTKSVGATLPCMDSLDAVLRRFGFDPSTLSQDSDLLQAGPLGAHPTDALLATTIPECLQLQSKHAPSLPWPQMPGCFSTSTSNTGAHVCPVATGLPGMSSSLGYGAGAMGRTPFAGQADVLTQPLANLRPAPYAAGPSAQHIAAFPAAGDSMCQQWFTQPHGGGVYADNSWCNAMPAPAGMPGLH